MDAKGRWIDLIRRIDPAVKSARAGDPAAQRTDGARACLSSRLPIDNLFRRSQHPPRRGLLFAGRLELRPRPRESARADEIYRVSATPRLWSETTRVTCDQPRFPTRRRRRPDRDQFRGIPLQGEPSATASARLDRWTCVPAECRLKLEQSPPIWFRLNGWAEEIKAAKNAVSKAVGGRDRSQEPAGGPRLPAPGLGHGLANTSAWSNSEGQTKA